MRLRHKFTALLLAGHFGLASLPAASTDAATKEWRFEAYLGDKPIGYHHFTLTRTGALEQLSSEAKFDVTFLSIPLFTYRHENTERWEGDCLTGIDSTTTQNGKHFRVEGAKDNDVFRLSTQDGDKHLPACISTFAYWDKSFLAQKRLLNSQTGDYLEVEVLYQGMNPLPLKDTEKTGHHYRLTAKDADIELWYSRDDDWLALQSTMTSGRVLRYVTE